MIAENAATYWTLDRWLNALAICGECFMPIEDMKEAFSCYECTKNKTWRHVSCAKKHIDKKGHLGQLNDLSYWVNNI